MESFLAATAFELENANFPIPPPMATTYMPAMSTMTMKAMPKYMAHTMEVLRLVQFEEKRISRTSLLGRHQK